MQLMRRKLDCKVFGIILFFRLLLAIIAICNITNRYALHHRSHLYLAQTCDLQMNISVTKHFTMFE